MRMSISRDIGVPVAPGGGSWLAASWARAHIRDLEDRYAAGNQDLEPAIIEVSKRFGVLSRFTAYVAIDRSEVVNRGGRLLQAVQPVEQPSGWGNAPSAPAASPARFGASSYQPQMGARPSPAYAPRPSGSMPPPAQSIPRPTESSPMPPSPSFDADACFSTDGVSSYDDSEDLGESPPPASHAPMHRSAPPTPGYASPPAAPSYSRRAPSYPPSGPSSARMEPMPAPVQAYLDKLAAFARELRMGLAATTRLRILRQRMTEWVEDVRSVGGHDDLATAVELLVTRLSEALAAAALDGNVLATIATELESLASGSPPPAAPTKSRVAFWK
jgi:Ca-activated chloride channel family protein